MSFEEYFQKALILTNAKSEDANSKLETLTNLFISESKSTSTNEIINSHRLRILTEIYKFAPDVANDLIARVRDALTFYTDPNYVLKKEENRQDLIDREISLMKILIDKPNINSFERLLCAVCLYNHDYIEICYHLFCHLAEDISVLIDYRVESSKYLMYSDLEEYSSVAKLTIKKLIDTKEYPSPYRYKLIMIFNSRTGISAMLNSNSLKYDYDEPFLYTLQNIFFWSTACPNGVRERILSAQHMLAMTSIEEKGVFGVIKNEEKNKITEELLKIATEFTIEEVDEEADTVQEQIENTRADAADVVARVGFTQEQRDRANQIIGNLGFAITSDGKRVRTLAEKQKTVFTNRQNVHSSSINECVNNFIKNVSKETISTSEIFLSYDVTHTEITNLIYSMGEIKPKQRRKAFASLNRISIDTATFTETNITSAEILVHVWRLIKKHKEVDESGKEYVKELLKQRLVEELIDSADTCSSGHASRLINVLSGYDVEIKISWEEQIAANLAARMQKKIMKTPEDLQEKILNGMIEGAEAEDKDAFLKFIMSEIPILKKELYKEFVEEGWINSTLFEKCFSEGTSKWV